MCSTHTATQTKTTCPLGAGCSGDADFIEHLIQEVRAELGNAGFSAAVGMTDLALDALDIAQLKIRKARHILADQPR